MTLQLPFLETTQYVGYSTTQTAIYYITVVHVLFGTFVYHRPHTYIISSTLLLCVHYV